VPEAPTVAASDLPRRLRFPASNHRTDFSVEADGSMSRTDERRHEVAGRCGAGAPSLKPTPVLEEPVTARALSGKRPSSARFTAAEHRQGGRWSPRSQGAASTPPEILDEGSCSFNIRVPKRRREIEWIGGAPGVPDSAATTQPTTRTVAETRLLALRLQRAPVPDLSKSEICSRWIIGPDTVRRLLRIHGFDLGPRKGLLVPLADILSCEGICNPLTIGAFASKDDRAVLRANLLTFDEWQERDARRRELPSVTCYRHLSKNQASSIRLGKLHRFRRDLAAAERWLTTRQEPGKLRRCAPLR
jgi:hypothetical protein